MNTVFESLSIMLIFFAGWFVFGLAAPIAILLGFIFITLNALSANSDFTTPRNRAKQMRFAPIDSPIVASLAAQLHSNMTIEQIERIVKTNTARSGIHTRVNKIER